MNPVYFPRNIKNKIEAQLALSFSPITLFITHRLNNSPLYILITLFEFEFENNKITWAKMQCREFDLESGFRSKNAISIHRKLKLCKYLI